MKLDKVKQRHKLINDLIIETYEFNVLAREFNDDNDWGAAKVTLDNLFAIERLIKAEEIFLETFDTLENVHHPNHEEKEHFITIFLEDGLNDFICEILLRDLEYTLKTLNNWGYRTKEGEQFRKFVSKQLESLIKKYKALYYVM